MSWTPRSDALEVQGAGDAVVVVRRWRCGGIIDDGDAVAERQEPDRRVGDADIGLHSHEHELIPTCPRHGVDDRRLARQPEHHLVVNGRSGRELVGQLVDERSIRWRCPPLWR